MAACTCWWLKCVGKKQSSLAFVSFRVLPLRFSFQVHWVRKFNSNSPKTCRGLKLCCGDN